MIHQVVSTSTMKTKAQSSSPLWPTLDKSLPTPTNPLSTSFLLGATANEVPHQPTLTFNTEVFVKSLKNLKPTLYTDMVTQKEGMDSILFRTMIRALEDQLSSKIGHCKMEKMKVGRSGINYKCKDNKDSSLDKTWLRDQLLMRVTMMRSKKMTLSWIDHPRISTSIRTLVETVLDTLFKQMVILTAKSMLNSCTTSWVRAMKTPQDNTVRIW